MKIHLYTVILLIIFFSSGCSSDSILNVLPVLSTELALKTTSKHTKNNTPSGILPLESNSSIGIILGEDLPVNNSIGVYVSSASESFVPYNTGNCTNLRWKQTINGWKQTNENEQYIPYFLKDNTAYLYTYYPYSEKASTSEPILYVKAGYTDYMYGKEENPVQSSDKKILMSHAMSTLSFTFSNNGYNGNCNLEAITLQNIACNGSMDLISGQITKDKTNGNLLIASYEDTKGYSPSLPDGSKGFNDPYNFKNHSIGFIDINSASYEKRIGRFHTMVFPEDIVSEDIKLNLTIDGEVKSVSFTSESKVQKWEAGKRYIYNIILKEDGNIEAYLEGHISDYIQEGLITESIGKKYYVINESGFDRLNRPTSPDSKSYSRAFQVAGKDISNQSWFMASGWDSFGFQQLTGCNAHKENGYNDWRIPTQKELEFIIHEINTGKSKITPLEGKYWSNYTSFIFNWTSSPFNVRNNNGKYTYNWDSSITTSQKLKVRCVRDLIK